MIVNAPLILSKFPPVTIKTKAQEKKGGSGDNNRSDGPKALILAHFPDGFPNRQISEHLLLTQFSYPPAGLKIIPTTG